MAIKEERVSAKYLAALVATDHVYIMMVAGKRKVAYFANTVCQSLALNVTICILSTLSL